MFSLEHFIWEDDDCPLCQFFKNDCECVLDITIYPLVRLYNFINYKLDFIKYAPNLYHWKTECYWDYTDNYNESFEMLVFSHFDFKTWTFLIGWPYSSPNNILVMFRSIACCDYSTYCYSLKNLA